MWIWIRIQWDPWFRTWIRTRIRNPDPAQEDQNDPQKKVINFIFWSAGSSLWRKPREANWNFIYNFFFQLYFFIFYHQKPGYRFTWNAGSGSVSGPGFNESGSTTKVFSGSSWIFSSFWLSVVETRFHNLKPRRENFQTFLILQNYRRGVVYKGWRPLFCWDKVPVRY